MRRTPWLIPLLALLTVPLVAGATAGGIPDLGPVRAEQELVCVTMNPPPEPPGYSIGTGCGADPEIAVSYDPATQELCIKVKGQGPLCQKLPIAYHNPLRDELDDLPPPLP